MEISGPNPNQPTYKEEFKQSVKLFQDSFNNMQSSTFDAQKAQYVKTMKESLDVMQDSASGMINQHLCDLKATLSSDLNQYLANPTDSNKQRIQKDLDSMKNA
ncbi:MAG: hypothetical protein HY860_01375 [Chlamydiales bacterium]|nr:hypothetical protein [Chlamydiales bacterium]